MAGEFLREAAALICTLGILERVTTGHPISFVYAAGMLATGLAFLAVGITIEARR